MARSAARARAQAILGALAVAFLCLVAAFVFEQPPWPRDRPGHMQRVIKRVMDDEARGFLVPARRLADFRWRLLHVFAPGTPRGEVMDRVGSDMLDGASDKRYRRGKRVPDDASLLVFVDGGAVVEEMEYPTDRVDFGCLAGGPGRGPVTRRTMLRVNRTDDGGAPLVDRRADDFEDRAACREARAG
jgi:hypothetical protein